MAFLSLKSLLVSSGSALQEAGHGSGWLGPPCLPWHGQERAGLCTLITARSTQEPKAKFRLHLRDPPPALPAPGCAGHPEGSSWLEDERCCSEEGTGRHGSRVQQQIPGRDPRIALVLKQSSGIPGNAGPAQSRPDTDLSSPSGHFVKFLLIFPLATWTSLQGTRLVLHRG